MPKENPHQLPTLISMRALALHAGVSTTIVRSRVSSGELKATAWNSQGGLLFKYSDAALLQPKRKRAAKKS